MFRRSEQAASVSLLNTPLLQFPSFGIHIRNLLEARTIIIP